MHLYGPEPGLNISETQFVFLIVSEIVHWCLWKLIIESVIYKKKIIYIMHVCERMYTEHFVIYAYMKTQFLSKTVMFSVRPSTMNDTILETEMFRPSWTYNKTN